MERGLCLRRFMPGFCAFIHPVFDRSTARRRCSCSATVPAMSEDCYRRCGSGWICLPISLPLQYRHVEPALSGATAPRQPDGMPSFHVIEGRAPRPGALFLGCVLSLAAIGASIPASHLLGSGTFQVAARGESAQAGSERGGSSVPAVTEQQPIVDAVISNLKMAPLWPLC